MLPGDELATFSEAQIADEPMLFNCTASAALKLGGPITRDFVERAQLLSQPPCVIDTRVHMLKPGWYPGIPGWHHDDIPRTRSDHQPDYDNPACKAKHVMAMHNGDVCPTQFVKGTCTLPYVPLGKIVYGEWHPQVQNLIDTGKLKIRDAPSGRLVYFDWQSIHQAQAARRDGWRWFARATFDTHRVATNQVRRQVQVYMQSPMGGW